MDFFRQHARGLSRLSAAPCLLALAIAGCSGDDSGNSSTSESSAGSSSESGGSETGSASSSTTASTAPTSGGSQTGGSGSTTTTTTAGTSDTTTTAGTDPSSSSGGTGAVSCEDATDEVDFFLNKNQPCDSDSDCVMLDASCWSETQDCCVLYINSTYDGDTWAFLYEQYQQACGVRECGCCAKVPFDPACVDGQCGPNQG